MRTVKSLFSFLPVLAVGALVTVSFPLFAQTDLSSHRLLSRTPIPTTCDRSLPECPDVATFIEIEIRDCTIEGVVYLPQSSDIDCPCYATSAPARSASAPNWPGCGPGSIPPPSNCQTNPTYPACCATNPPGINHASYCLCNPTASQCRTTQQCTQCDCPGQPSCGGNDPPDPPDVDTSTNVDSSVAAEVAAPPSTQSYAAESGHGIPGQGQGIQGYTVSVNADGTITVSAIGPGGKAMTRAEIQAAVDEAVATKTAEAEAAVNSVDVFNGNDPDAPGDEGGLPDFGDEGP